MAESLIQVTEGTGKKIHTSSRLVGANTVEDAYQLPGEYPGATYMVGSGAVSAAVSNDHVLAIWAGASSPVRIRRITIYHGNPTANAQVHALISIMRLTTAGSGGTAVTPVKYDPGSAAAGATARTLPTGKGTETDVLRRLRLMTFNAAAATGSGEPSYVEWEQHPGGSPIIIPAGVANGIALKIGGSYTGLTLDINVEFVELGY